MALPLELVLIALLPRRCGRSLTVRRQDTRSYRIITLENGLTALLVSDPDTDKAAASLDVNIGSFAEPTRALGLAHFLEHMLSVPLRAPAHA